MEVAVNNSCVLLWQGDITTLAVDAIVNAANARLAGGGGVDGAIHRAGGPAIMEECRKTGGCPTGQAVVTTAGNLLSGYVVHTVGPVYRDGSRGEPELLQKAYANSLKAAEEKKVSSIAFPSISTGVYGYPIEKAARIALAVVREYLEGDTCIQKVVFVLFSLQDLGVYQKVLEGIAER
ncbi:MAG: O-acetyl-ADP-ribose deacetylase [Deltaproteobacteria bacterium]|nr:O-acetyl-ADP-ribose deacetylase [Deltaproteobacteria bacterium]